MLGMLGNHNLIAWKDGNMMLIQLFYTVMYSNVSYRVEQTDNCLKAYIEKFILKILKRTENTTVHVTTQLCALGT